MMMDTSLEPETTEEESVELSEEMLAELFAALAFTRSAREPRSTIERVDPPPRRDKFC